MVSVEGIVEDENTIFAPLTYPGHYRLYPARAGHGEVSQTLRVRR